MWLWFAKLGSPKWFYELSSKWLPWLVGAMVLTIAVATVWALLYLPPDYQQGYTSRILIVHVAVAGTSLAFFPHGCGGHYHASLENEAGRHGCEECSGAGGLVFIHYSSYRLYLGQCELGHLVGVE